MMPAIHRRPIRRGSLASSSARCCAAVSFCFAALLVSGCHHTPVQAAVVPSLPAATESPVMVSVPPPTHRSTPEPDSTTTLAGIPVVKPVDPPKTHKRKASPPPPVQTNTATLTPAPVPAPAPAPTAAQTLGQLTTDADSSAVTRESAGQAVRTQRDRLNAVNASVQTANATQVDQIRRFVKSAVDAWNGSDYTAAMTLATKAKVLLDDLPKQ